MTKIIKKNDLAPIVIFTYNRPKHLKETIGTLQLNELATFSDLFIYSDGPKDNNDKGVFKVREYLKTINGFRSIKIIESDKNIGLASSIINGVTKVINEYGKAIVLEDDIATSPYFLDYMNKALNVFEKEKRVWHVSGWNYPVLTGEMDEAILWRMMHCWGWATWQDRWQHFEKNPSKLIETFSKEDIHKFNLDGFENFWQQILDNQSGQINTWAIFWYASIFKNHGLCLNPAISLTKNIGFDNSGVHCKERNDLLDLGESLNLIQNLRFPKKIIENKTAVARAQSFLKYNSLIGSVENTKSELENTKLELENTKLELENTKLELEDLKRNISDLGNVNMELTQTIIMMQNTKLWRLAEKIRGFAKFLLPKTSLQREILKKTYHLCLYSFQYLPMLFKVRLKNFIKYFNSDTNRKSKKIVYIGHSYHDKTQSTAFLINYLKEHFEVTVVLDETWQGKAPPNLDFIDDSYLGVVFFQRIYSPEILAKIKNKNLIFFPMYDGIGKAPNEYWVQYKNIKFFNFSKTLHKKLISLGLNSLYLQYFPKPSKFFVGNTQKVFFWQRLTHININTIEQLFTHENKLKVYLHKAIDPQHTFLKPTKEQERKFSISYSTWFKNKEELLNLIKKSAIYVAPRENEGIGLSFLEAMAMGKAVVAANNPTMNEYIRHNKNGYLFDLNNIKPINLNNLDLIQKKSYKFISSGYKKWEKNKIKIINFIKK